MAYDEKLCEYFPLEDTSMDEAIDGGRELVSTAFIIPYPPGFPILVPGQVISKEILHFMRALDVKEIHGYRADLGPARVHPGRARRAHAGRQPGAPTAASPPST